ncbi:Mov34/MPN/PAD-1 family protein [Aureobasidium pullulans]|nr:Mov34/MPN/PAD-1 family protein [Aureobasidium pullulans]TIA67286.1 Mov34/MPN/PAD-1 family protein [Aureobasidium pullulans]
MDEARKTWELENAVNLTDATRDQLYTYSVEQQKDINNKRPWRADPNHFKHVRISSVALLKMVMHARSGGSIEVMGLMIGYVLDETFIVTDALRLPVEGTETRVNAQDEANEYMVKYLDRSRQAGQLENAVGWYHSHPGYGCWLSGIDVSTQFTQQTFSDPFVAVVIDPDRTVSSGKVEIGAFRTYPEGHVPAGHDSAGEGMAAVPLAKAADFGAHANKYYSLDVSHYKSSLDNTLLEALWNKYWVQTLSSSPLSTNREYGTKQIEDLAGKIHQVTQNAKHRGSMSMRPGGPKGDAALDKVVAAADKIANEEKTGLLAAQIKEKVFSTPSQAAANSDGNGIEVKMQEAMEE